MNFPDASNSRSCAAAAMYDGPLTLPRENTNTWPFELSATPATSPKFISGGSFSGFGTDSNASVGGICCATIKLGANGRTVASRALTASSLFMTGDSTADARCGAQGWHDRGSTRLSLGLNRLIG